MQRPKITTFYEGCGAKQNEELWLIDIWKEAWKRIGWEPQVLRLVDCLDHPKFARLLDKSNCLPTVNDRCFERLCFLRWLAFSKVGGALSDYDVFPRQSIPIFPETVSTNGSSNVQPGFVVVSKDWCERFIDRILEFPFCDQDAHISDQTIMQQTPGLFDQVEDLCCVFGDPGWETKPLVHFTNASLSNRFKPIRAIMHL